MSIESNEEAMLTAFARAASKAQEVEAILRDTIIGVEVVNDTRNRSFEAIAKEIDKLPLGELKRRYLETVEIKDALFLQMWKEINENRIFLMHNFFHVFPVTALTGNKEAATRLAKIDKILDIGRRQLKDMFEMTLGQFGIPPAKFREFLALVVDHRKKAKAAE
jgi:hypothetical protein